MYLIQNLCLLYNDLLNRIRVIHSEGESLYREFKIPDEESVEQPSEQVTVESEERPVEE